MTNEQFDTTIQSVIQRLPREVVTTLTGFWESTPTKLPEDDEEVPAPKFCLAPGSETPPNDSSMIRKNPHPGLLAFNVDFLTAAPIEVVESVIAESLAESYLKITDPTRFPWGQATPREVLIPLVAEWGFSSEDITLYLATQASHPENASAWFYAHRFVHRGRQPHLAADTDAIVAVLQKKGCGHLEANLRSGQRSTVRVLDAVTNKLMEIPRCELAPGYMPVRGVPGVEGVVYVNQDAVRLESRPKHGGLSEEFKRVIRYCMTLVGNADPRTFLELVSGFLCDAHPKPELMLYFRSALVFRHFAATEMVSGTQLHRMWRWIVHCSITEPSTAMETWEWGPEDRDLFQRIANYYYSCDYEAEFKKLFDKEKVFCLPLNPTKEK